MTTIKLTGEIVDSQLKVDLPADLQDGIVEIELTLPEDRTPTPIIGISVECCDTSIVVCRAGTVLWKHSPTNNVGGLLFVQTVVQYMRIKRQLQIDMVSARHLLIDIGSALPLTQERTKMVAGRQIETGIPTRTEVSSIEVREAIEPDLFALEHTIRRILTAPFPEEAVLAEFTNVLQTQPLQLTGEFALMRLDERLQTFLGIPVLRVNDE